MRVRDGVGLKKSTMLSVEDSPGSPLFPPRSQGVSKALFLQNGGHSVYFVYVCLGNGLRAAPVPN